MANAKPAGKMVKPNTDKPNVKTFVRCDKCGSKFVLEEEGSCPEGCGNKKKKKSAE